MSLCQSFPKILQQEGSKVGSMRYLTNCFLWERGLIFLHILSFITLHPFLCATPFSLLLPNHINSLCPSLLNIHPHYFSHAYPIFISFTGITLPLFPTTVSQSCLSPPCLPPPLPILFLPFSLPRPLSSLSFSLSRMSDHSLVFRLPCHHIFHTTPSLNWACIIISYHVEYLITARDERWPPPIPSQTDRHAHTVVSHKHRQPSSHKHVSGRMGQESEVKAVSVHIFTPHVCTKLLMWLLQHDRRDGVFSKSVQWCLHQLLVAFVTRQRMPCSQQCHIYR